MTTIEPTTGERTQPSDLERARQSIRIARDDAFLCAALAQTAPTRGKQERARDAAEAAGARAAEIAANAPEDSRIRCDLQNVKIAVTRANRALQRGPVPTEQWVPSYSSWRHGGWYVDNLNTSSGAVGCVSRNYPDKKWRIVCDPRKGSYPGGPNDHTYPNRDAAARAERELVAMGVH